MCIIDLVSQPNLSVQKIENPSSRGIAFTFNAYGQAIQPGPGFGGNWLLRLGFDIVALQSQDDTWWQSLTEEQLQHIADKAMLAADGRPYSIRFSYGSSMGGYGAILFAERFAIQKAIAISPQYDIRDPRDQRWAERAKVIRFIHEIDQQDLRGCRVYVFYDPHDADGWHADQIGRIAPDCVLVKLPFAGHPAGRFMIEAGVLKEPVEAIILNDTDDALWGHMSRSALRPKRRLSMQYFWGLSARALYTKRYGLALALIERAIALQPDRAHELLLARSLALEGLGRYEEAMASVQTAIPFLEDKRYANERLAYLAKTKRHSALAAIG